MEARIADIESMLKNVKIIDQDELTTELIHIGSKVQVKDVEFDEVCTYQIVGSSEADPQTAEFLTNLRWERACLAIRLAKP